MLVGKWLRAFLRNLLAFTVEVFTRLNPKQTQLISKGNDDRGGKQSFHTEQLRASTPKNSA